MKDLWHTSRFECLPCSYRGYHFSGRRDVGEDPLQVKYLRGFPGIRARCPGPGLPLVTSVSLISNCRPSILFCFGRAHLDALQSVSVFFLYYLFLFHSALKMIVKIFCRTLYARCQFSKFIFAQASARPPKYM